MKKVKAVPEFTQEEFTKKLEEYQKELKIKDDIISKTDPIF